MKRTSLTLAAICGILLTFVNSASAQNSQPHQQVDSKPQINSISAGAATADSVSAGDSTIEVQALKRRVEDVENQNRLLMQMVTELKARLDQSSRPEEKRNHPTPVPA